MWDAKSQGRAPYCANSLPAGMIWPKRRVLLLLGLFGSLSVFLIVGVYRAHSNDFCLAKGGRLADREFYHAALIAAYQHDPFLIEMLQVPRVQSVDGSPSLITLTLNGQRMQAEPRPRG